MIVKNFYDPGHVGRFLSDRHINADNALSFLVDDGIDRDRRFAGTAVADDQLALAAADRNHRVDRLDPSLQWFFNRLAVGNPRRFELSRSELGRFNRALAVNRLADGIDYPADHRLANRQLYDPSGALHRVAFANQRLAAEQHRTDVVLLQVQHHAINALREFQQFAGHRAFESINPRDAVANRNNGSDIINDQIHLIIFDLLFDKRSNFFWSDFHGQLVTSIPVASFFNKTAFN